MIGAGKFGSTEAYFFGGYILLVLTIVYILATLLLTVYAFNAWVMTGLYLKHRGKPGPIPLTGSVAEPSSVTVQLPIYNEALVIERLLKAVVGLRYPPHLLQIQVLDDSTDETTEIAGTLVEQYRRQGFNISLLHRTDRTGFKAGALREGLARATGEFIAIFDADFVPRPDFLQQTLPFFSSEANLGFVQTRWGHLNRDYSLLTLAQSLALDGHFVIEQTARNRAGLMMNFNGTAGVWRRACIEKSGGWQSETISEDFDLSYRAQLAGWRCLYLPDVVAPAEIPPQLAAFKRQQFRWAKGSIQCLKKLGGRVVRAEVSWWVKWQALVHLSSYLLHPLMVVLAVIMPVFMIADGANYIRFPLFYLSLISFGPPLLFAIAQAGLYPKTWLRHYTAMPLLVLLGSGIALSNTKAVFEALLGIENDFRRTPKFNVIRSGDRWQSSSYRLPFDWLVLGELSLSVYSFAGAWLAASDGDRFAVPFILLYAFSFGYVGWQGLWDARAEWRSWFEVRFRRSAQPAKPGGGKPVGVER